MIKFQLSDLEVDTFKVNNTVNYRFGSLVELMLLLFEKYAKKQQGLLVFKTLLAESGYARLGDIPIEEIDRVIELAKELTVKYEILYDGEQLCYHLLSAVVNKNIFVFIDNRIINNIQAPVHITPDSVMVLVHDEKIDTIEFKTL
jgi:hypothetical protein